MILRTLSRRKLPFAETDCLETQSVFSRPARCGLGIAIVLVGIAGCTTAPTQSQREVAAIQMEVGSDVIAPRPEDAASASAQPLECEILCSAFNPRQSVAQVLWPEQTTMEAASAGGSRVDLGLLRLDLVGAARRFEDGEYGTVRLNVVPEIESEPDVGFDLEQVRTAVSPAVLQTVRDNRVIARDLALPGPEELSRQRIPGVVEQFSVAEREAMRRDALTGGLGSIRVMGQSVYARRSVPVRTVVLEGLQPGLTYKIRLVQDAQSEAESLAYGICRVPVCPADFIEQ